MNSYDVYLSPLTMLHSTGVARILGNEKTSQHFWRGKRQGTKNFSFLNMVPDMSSARSQEGESKNDTLDTPPRQEQQYTHRIPSQNLSSKHIVTHMVEWSRNNTNIYLIPVKVSQSLKAAGWRRGAKKINKNKKLQK